jgi:mono/diheme cytochrome c family protein
MLMADSFRTHATAALFAVLAVASARAQTPVPDGDAQNGQKLFVSSYCSACHGTLGQGSTAGARIAPRPIAFAAFQKYLRQPTGQMVPYTRTVLSDRALADIYAFLRSVPVPASSKDIPLLRQ